MLSLDAGRPSRAPSSDQAAGFRPLTDRDNWPPLWAIIVLLGSMVGCFWAPVTGLLAPAFLLRAAAMGPLLLVSCPGWWRALVWVVTALLAWNAGAMAAARLDARPAATAPGLHEPSIWNVQEGLAALRVTARPRAASGGGWTAPARLLSWHPGPSGDDVWLHAGRSLRVQEMSATPRAGDGVLIRSRDKQPLLGDVVGGRWRLSPPRRTAVDGGFDEAAWLYGRGLCWVAMLADGQDKASCIGAGKLHGPGRLQAKVQERARRLLCRGLPPRESALAGAVLLGGGTERSLREPFIRTGLAHLFALSGLHVGIVSGLLLLALRLLIRGPGGPLPLMAVALVLYALLVDTPDSVVRAVGLVLLTLGLRAAGRPVDGLRVLGLLFWINVLWRPEGLFDAGFRLSYLAAGGIVLGNRLMEPVLAAWPGLARRAARGMVVSLAAQTATIPVLAASFGVLPLAAPLVNVLAVPFFGLAAAFLAAGLLVSAAWGWAGQGILACGWLMLRALQAATLRAGSLLGGLELGLPVWGPSRTLLYAACLALLAIVLRQPRHRLKMLAVVLHPTLLLVAAGWGQGPPWQRGARAWQFSVGQGDCALVVLPDGWTCLIDAGGPGRQGGGPVMRDVVPFLRRLNLRTIEAGVLTHGHADHTGGARDLTRTFRVDRWYVAGKARAPDSLMKEIRPVAGDTLHSAGEWALVCVHPPDHPWSARNENDLSLSLALCRGGRMHALWSGDLEAPGERVMLAGLPPVGDHGLDYWKAGHHGSRTSGTPELLARTEPGLVVISCGVANRYKHPSHGPYAGADHARTDLQGTVRMSWDRRGRWRWQALHPLPPMAMAPP